MSEAYPTFLAGQRITASLLSSAQAMVARKTADTSRSSTTTPTADPHLQFTVLANATYILDGWVKYDASTAADFQLDWTTPAGALGEWIGYGAGHSPVISFNTTPAIVSDSQQSRGYPVRLESNDVSQSRSFGGLGVGIALAVDIRGIIRVASTGGTYSMDWSQLASDATNTTVYADSWLRLQRIA